MLNHSKSSHPYQTILLLYDQFASNDKDLRVMAAGGLWKIMPERAVPILMELARTERFLNAGWTALFFIQSEIDKNFQLPPLPFKP